MYKLFSLQIKTNMFIFNLGLKIEIKVVGKTEIVSKKEDIIICDLSKQSNMEINSEI